MGQGRGSASPPAGRLGDLPHLGLGHQDHVSGHLLGDAGADRERASELHEPAPGRVPRDHGLGEIELPGESGQNSRSGLSEGGERTSRAPELGGEAMLPDARQPPPGLDDGDEPASRLEAEGDRERLLHQGPARHERRAVIVGEPGAVGRESFQIGQDHVQRPRRDEHRAGVRDVLAGRAPMHLTPGSAGYLGGESLYERYHRVARGAPGSP